MRLTHIAIRDLAGIGRVELRDLAPGLNVLVGNNEAGKSTVLTALRAAIFHRHGSGSRFVRDLAPYSKTARPEVDLEFEIEGRPYRLEKRFLQKPEARLFSDGADLVGDAVEDRLAELFGFAPYSGRGEFELEKHQGTFGLLWVEQGRSTQGLDLGAGRDAVAASLEAEVGQILGGDRGRGLIAASKAIRDRSFTATGKVAAGSELFAAERVLRDLGERLAERRQTRRVLDDAIDRLADRRRIVARHRRDRVIEAATEALAKAEAREQGLEARRRDLTEAQQSVEIAEAAVERGAGELMRRGELNAAAEAAVEARREAGERFVEAAAALDAVRARREPAEALRREADEHLQAVEAALRLAERAAAHGDLASRLTRLRQTLAASGQAVARIAEARTALARASLGEADLKAILAADAACREAAIGRDAAAPALVFHPDAGQTVGEGEGGEPVPAARPVRLVRRTSFRLGGFGRIDIVPDAASETREAAFRKAETILAGLLRTRGLADADAAQRLREATRGLEAAAREAEVELKARAPDGVGALEAETARLAADLADLPEIVPGEDRDAAALGAQRLAGRERLTASDRALEALRREDGEARSLVARAEVALEAAAARGESLAGRRAEARAAASDEALAERLAGAETVRAAKAVVLAAIRRDYEAADPAAIRREVERARAALGHAARDLSTVEGEIRDLEAEIRQTGGLGIGEEIDRLEAEGARGEERLARLRLEADAARLLHDTLTKAEARVRRTWFAPIRREVEPYLKLIHPGTEVAFDDATLAITGLTRGGVEERFERLSAGAREQVAVVARLALAEVLKRGGHPAAVILDDAREHGRGPPAADAPRAAEGGRGPAGDRAHLPLARLPGPRRRHLSALIGGVRGRRASPRRGREAPDLARSLPSCRRERRFTGLR